MHVWSGPTCYGFTGYTYPDYQVDLICAGNNYGYIETYNANNGIYDLFPFSEGQWFPSRSSEWGPGIYLVYLEIDGWSGSDSC